MVLLGCKSQYVIKNVSEVEIAQLQTDIGYLASDELEGREIGTKGEALAAAYVASRMKAIGLKAMGEDGFLQHFSIHLKSNPHADAPAPDDPVIKGRNVIGMLDNGAEKTICIGAHYDHLGYGKEGSLYIGEPKIHNGADDNASGVGAMLLLAERLSKLALNYNYLFVGFSGEEKGLWGSKHFVNNSTIPLPQIDAMINLDMVGRLRPDHRISVHGNGTSPIWGDLISKADDGFIYSFSPSGIGPSDHTSFYLVNIPVLFFFTGQHSDYHKPSDDVELINYQGIQKISNLIQGVILQLDKQPDIPFQKTKDETAETPEFKVTLGVMPDYMYTGKGMRIDAVREERAAHRADIMAGDVVVKMGELEIFDMMSYMKALSAFEPGTTIKVTVKRGNEEIEKMVTFEEK